MDAGHHVNTQLLIIIVIRETLFDHSNVILEVHKAHNIFSGSSTCNCKIMYILHTYFVINRLILVLLIPEIPEVLANQRLSRD